MIVNKRFRLQTKGNTDIVDITAGVKSAVAAAGVKNGMVVVFVTASTAAITTVEYEPGLVADMREALERLVPRGLPYRHNLTVGDDNGHSHVRATMIGPSLTVPLVDEALTLGIWQQIVLIDFDVRSRAREIIVQVVGE